MIAVDRCETKTDLQLARLELEVLRRHRLKKELGVVQKGWNWIFLEEVGP